MGFTLRNGEARRKDLQKELDRIVGILQTQDVEQVILFGSLARGDVRSTSDIDIIVVRQTDKRFLDRLDEVYTLVQPETALDVLVYTPQEFASMRENSSFVRRAVREGRVLYAREP